MQVHKPDIYGYNTRFYLLIIPYETGCQVQSINFDRISEIDII